MTITYEWRGAFDDAELNALHAEGFDHAVLEDDWWSQVNRHSLGWVCARDEAAARLIGFVNVPWDGGVHAFVLDTLVSVGARHLGVGTQLVAVAAREARAAGCEWLHVDFETTSARSTSTPAASPRRTPDSFSSYSGRSSPPSLAGCRWPGLPWTYRGDQCKLRGGHDYSRKPAEHRAHRHRRAERRRHGCS